jgi:hypothetical protein
VPVGSGGSSSKKVRTSAVIPWLGKTRQGLGFWGKAELAADWLHPRGCSECAFFCTSIFLLQLDSDRLIGEQKLLTPCQSFTYWDWLRRLRRKNSGVRFGARNASSLSNKRGRTKSMTFTLFQCLQQFPNSRSGWRSGLMYRLS